MTNEQLESLPATGRRKHAGRPIRLQERDLDLLTSLAVGRFLTVHALEWLHYPDWRERYRAFLERRKADPTLIFYPTPNLYRRLTALRTGAEPLVYRIARTLERASLVFNRLPDAYTLSVSGAELLCTRRGYELADLWYEDTHTRSIKNFEHAVAIGTFYAALRSSLEFSGLHLADWRGDHILAGRDQEQGGSNYDRVAVPGLRGELPVLPDATCTVNGARYFVEIDRGTSNLKSWGEKIRAYEAYRRSPKLMARYATDAFTVLVVAPTEPRLLRIVEEVLKVTRQPTPMYLYLLEEKVHPTTIRPAWRVVQTCEWKRRKVIDRLVDVPVNMRLTTHPLWQNPT